MGPRTTQSIELASLGRGIIVGEPRCPESGIQTGRMAAICDDGETSTVEENLVGRWRSPSLSLKLPAVLMMIDLPSARLGRYIARVSDTIWTTSRKFCPRVIVCTPSITMPILWTLETNPRRKSAKLGMR